MRLPAGVSGGGNVTLDSLTIYRTHEWFGKPVVYFSCQGEEKVYLPDVLMKDHEYNFTGEESWQPLTSLEGSKCKRCGLYEEDKIKHDDIFDEWELCPINFSSEPVGQYNHFKDKECNITFSCPQCHPSDAKPAVVPAPFEEIQHSKKHSALSIVLACLGILTFTALLYVGYMKWQQRKREEQQARFMKLFEDDDDLETELGFRDI